MASKLLHYDTFHELVKRKKLVPEDDINASSVWVGILHHTKLPTADAQKNEFLWFKANPIYTLRTLAHFYYERNPIDDLALQYKLDVPNSALSIKDIRPKSPRDNLLILYAIDGSECVNNKRLQAGIRRNEQNRACGGAPHAEVIQVDDDAHSSIAHRTRNATNDPVQCQHAETGNDNGAMQMHGQLMSSSQPTTFGSTSDFDHAPGLEPVTQLGGPGVQRPPQDSGRQTAPQQADMHQQSPALVQKAPQAKQSAAIPPISIREESEVPDWAPAWARDRDQFRLEDTFHCPVIMCKAEVQVQPFTRFDGEGRPTCVIHTIGYLQSHGKLAEAAAIEQEIQCRKMEKDIWNTLGWGQHESINIRPHKPRGPLGLNLHVHHPEMKPLLELQGMQSSGEVQPAAKVQLPAEERPAEDLLADMDPNGFFPGMQMGSGPVSSAQAHDGGMASRTIEDDKIPASQANYHQDVGAYYGNALAEHEAMQYGPWDGPKAQQHDDIIFGDAQDMDQDHLSMTSSPTKRAPSEEIGRTVFEDRATKKFKGLDEIAESEDEQSDGGSSEEESNDFHDSTSQVTYDSGCGIDPNVADDEEDLSIGLMADAAAASDDENDSDFSDNGSDDDDD